MPTTDPPLLTDRLELRPLAVDDAAEIARLLEHDPEAVAMTSRIPIPCTVAAAHDWIAQATSAGGHAFAIRRRADGRFLGVVGFAGQPERVGLGYWIARPFWSQGYATEAVRRALHHARVLCVAAFEAETFPENPASARVLEKLGFRVAGERERELPARGGRRRLVRHILP